MGQMTLSTDPDTHAAILADAARLADGGNLQAAADALRTALEIDFQQQVVDVLTMVDNALRGELDPEIALAAIEELTELELPIEVDESEMGIPADDSNAAETMPGDAIATAGGAGPGPANSAFETAPRRPATGMLLDDLTEMLANASASQSERQSPALETNAPRDVTVAPPSLDELTADPSAELADTPFEHRPTDPSRVRFRGAAPPPPAYRRRAVTPVASEPPKVEYAADDDFDFFGDVYSGGSHLDVQPEVFTEGSLADAVAAPTTGEAQATTARWNEPVKGVDSQWKSAPAEQTQPIPQASINSNARWSREPFPETNREPNLDSGAMTPAVGNLVVEELDAFRTGRLRPAGDNRPRQPVSDLLDRVRVLLGRSDLASANQLVNEVLASDPGHGEAQSLARDITGRLAMLRVAMLEPMDRIPIQNLAAAAEAGLSPRSMFVLSMADGSSSLEDLIDLSGMSRSDATEILAELIEKGALQL